MPSKTFRTPSNRTFKSRERPRAPAVGVALNRNSLPLSTKPFESEHPSSSLLTGKLKLFLDSSSIQEFEYWSRRGLFNGFTTNPLILEQDGVRCNVADLTRTAHAGFELGADEVHLQSWGDNPRRLVSHALDLAGIDPRRVVVKLPCTDDGVVAANLLRDSGIRVSMTGIYMPRQILTALGVSAEYAEANLKRMTDVGMDACCEVLKMQHLLTQLSARMRLLVKGVRGVDEMVTLASQGCDTFTLSPEIAQQLLHEPQTDVDVARHEAAALRNQ